MAAKLRANDPWLRWAGSLPSVGIWLGIVLLVPVIFSQLGVFRYQLQSGRFGDLSPISLQERGEYRAWFKLDEFSRLPDDLVMAATEVGLPAALNPRKTIIDLSGLNETQFAIRPFSAERLFVQYRPDLIYLPHPDYQATLAAIMRSPLFIGHYEIIDPGKMVEGPYVLGVAIRRDSRYYKAMRAIAAAGMK